MIHFAQKPRHAIYNIGSASSSNSATWLKPLKRFFPGSVLNLGKGEFATGSAIDYVPKTGYDIETCLDISRIKEEFGFVPEYDLEKGLSGLIAWDRDESYL